MTNYRELIDGIYLFKFNFVLLNLHIRKSCPLI